MAYTSERPLNRVLRPGGRRLPGGLTTSALGRPVWTMLLCPSLVKFLCLFFAWFRASSFCVSCRTSRARLGPFSFATANKQFLCSFFRHFFWLVLVHFLMAAARVLLAALVHVLRALWSGPGADVGAAPRRCMRRVRRNLIAQPVKIWHAAGMDFLRRRRHEKCPSMRTTYSPFFNKSTVIGVKTGHRLCKIK